MSRVILEVAVSRVEDAIAAQQAGADRLEVSSALELGGLTPSAALVKQVRARCTIPIIAMVRPRPGGFVYSDTEFETMLEDVESSESDGVAFGILKDDRTIDVDRCRRIMGTLGKKQAVFHRAFDVLADPLRAIDQLIDLGFARVLTSGQARTALEGAALIRKLMELARGRIEILPGGGIRAENVAELSSQTHCTQIHGTFSAVKADAAGLVCDPRYRVTDAQQVARVRETMDKFC